MKWVHYLAGQVPYTISELYFYYCAKNDYLVLLVNFHILTEDIISIGVFPYVMIIGSSLFDANPSKALSILAKELLYLCYYSIMGRKAAELNYLYKTKMLLSASSFSTSISIRYTLSNELFWTEEGFRFSWRVMEKQVMQHLKSEMQYQKKSQLTIVTFDSISRKTNGIPT
jgi:hypothetical protein